MTIRKFAVKTQPDHDYVQGPRTSLRSPHRYGEFRGRVRLPAPSGGCSMPRRGSSTRRSRQETVACSRDIYPGASSSPLYVVSGLDPRCWHSLERFPLDGIARNQNPLANFQPRGAQGSPMHRVGIGTGLKSFDLPIASFAIRPQHLFEPIFKPVQTLLGSCL